VRQIAIRTTDGRVVCQRCYVADGVLTRMRGLLGRSTLEVDEGLLLKPGGSVHTFFMRFPIDVVFIDRDGRVTRVVRDLAPWRVAGSRRARTVLELPAGASARAEIAPGTLLSFVG
jgi:uncharacterized membrane protein (UPF0127 family)